jgi:hypothetical protein
VFIQVLGIFLAIMGAVYLIVISRILATLERDRGETVIAVNPKVSTDKGTRSHDDGGEISADELHKLLFSPDELIKLHTAARAHEEENRQLKIQIAELREQLQEIQLRFNAPDMTAVELPQLSATGARESKSRFLSISLFRTSNHTEERRTASVGRATDPLQL